MDCFKPEMVFICHAIEARDSKKRKEKIIWYQIIKVLATGKK
jgi:hypothetical protein